jgi:hypothetical protein
MGVFVPFSERYAYGRHGYREAQEISTRAYRLGALRYREEYQRIKMGVDRKKLADAIVLFDHSDLTVTAAEARVLRAAVHDMVIFSEDAKRTVWFWHIGEDDVSEVVERLQGRDMVWAVFTCDVTKRGLEALNAFDGVTSASEDGVTSASEDGVKS